MRLFGLQVKCQKMLMEKKEIKSLQAGKMGMGTNAVGDLIAKKVTELPV